MIIQTSKNRVLVDSSFLYALTDPSDKYRAAALAFAESRPELIRIVPDVALTEVTHLLGKFIGHRAVIRFLTTFATSDMIVQSIAMSDIVRATAIMQKHADARFDFVDCCILALAERLNVTQICTFDHRDFSIFKPAHCDFLELLP